MTARFALLAVSLSAALTITRLAADTVSLTLEQILADAENVNLTVLTGRELMAQSEQDVRSARSVVLPEITLRASQFRRDTGDADPADDFSAGLYGAMPLFDLRAYDSLKAVKRSVDISRYRYEQAVQQVQAAVAGAYFEHRANIAYDSVIAANIARAQVLLDLASNRLKAGVATQIDVTRAEAELVTAQQAKLQQETTIVTSAMRLKRLLNLDLDLDFTLDEFYVRRELDAGVRALPLDTVLAQRADYQAALAEVDRLRFVRRAYARERVPAVDAVVQGGVTSDTPADGEEESFWTAGVELSMPIFEGNRISANVRRTDSEIRQADYSRQDLALAIGSEFRIAIQDVQSQLAQIEVAEKNLVLAAEELRLARVRYEQGVADNRELIDAENRYSNTSFNLVRSLYFYHLARVELARVRGDVRLVLQERGSYTPPAPLLGPAPGAPAAPPPAPAPAPADAGPASAAP